MATLSYNLKKWLLWFLLWVNVIKSVNANKTAIFKDHTNVADMMGFAKDTIHRIQSPIFEIASFSCHLT